VSDLDRTESSDRTVFLQRSIADLDAEHAAGDLSDADHARLRERYEAALSRAADECGRDTAGGGHGVSRPQLGVRRVWAIGAVVLVAALAGTLVARSSGERVAGQASSGNIDQGTSDKLARAQQLVSDGRVLDAIKQYDAVLQTEPRNPVALAQRGWVLRNAGLVDDGLRYVDRAVAADPSYPDAHFFRAMILWRDKHEAGAAVAEFRLFLAATPNSQDAAQVEPLLQQAMAEANGQPAPGPTPPQTTTVPQR
jgi:tetratricopeptide (TPR) repeat protein